MIENLRRHIPPASISNLACELIDDLRDIYQLSDRTTRLRPNACTPMLHMQGVVSTAVTLIAVRKEELRSRFLRNFAIEQAVENKKAISIYGSKKRAINFVCQIVEYISGVTEAESMYDGKLLPQQISDLMCSLKMLSTAHIRYMYGEAIDLDVFTALVRQIEQNPGEGFLVIDNAQCICRKKKQLPLRESLEEVRTMACNDLVPIIVILKLDEDCSLDDWILAKEELLLLEDIKHSVDQILLLSESSGRLDFVKPKLSID